MAPSTCLSTGIGISLIGGSLLLFPEINVLAIVVLVIASILIEIGIIGVAVQMALQEVDRLRAAETGSTTPGRA